MKKIINILLIIGLINGLFSCDKSSYDDSKITYFLDYEIIGGNVYAHPVGTPFVDPGVIAMEGEEDVSSTIQARSNVNENTVGVYTITYSGLNEDGLASSVTRTVVVYEPGNYANISGEYIATDDTYRFPIAGGNNVSYSGYPVNIVELAPGIFSVDDFFGGYYNYYTDYGVSYAMGGYFRLYEDNTIELISSFIPGWGDSLDELHDGKYDSSTNTISWGAQYADTFIFYVTLTK